jgi:hypothetical protein
MSLNDAVEKHDVNSTNDETPNDETPTDETPDANPSANPASDGTPTEVLADSKDEDGPELVEAEKPATVETDVDFVIAQTTDPRRNIPGTSQYLDEVERRNAELIRAKAEDREPDLEAPPAFQGTPLYTVAQAKQQGLDTDGDAVQIVTLPVVQTEEEAALEGGLTYDAFHGAGASVAVNQGTPVKS